MHSLMLIMTTAMKVTLGLHVHSVHSAVKLPLEQFLLELDSLQLTDLNIISCPMVIPSFPRKANKERAKKIHSIVNSLSLICDEIIRMAVN